MTNIIDFFKNIQSQDYILFFVSIFLVLTFFALGINKLYKAIFGVLIGFTIFMMLNLGFNFLNTNSDLYLLNGIGKYLQNHKELILILSFFSIPIFPIMMMFNQSVDFHSRSNKYIKYVKIFIGGMFLVPLILAILNSILKNKLLFGIDYTIIGKLKSYELLNNFLAYFESSEIYQNIDKYGYLILLILLIYVFYELIFSGLFNLIFKMLKKLFIKIAERIKSDMKKDSSGHDEDKEEHGGHDEDHGHH